MTLSLNWLNGNGSLSSHFEYEVFIYPLKCLEDPGEARKVVSQAQKFMSNREESLKMVKTWSEFGKDNLKLKSRKRSESRGLRFTCHGSTVSFYNGEELGA
ncbi:unnamed protein product [Linum trigynum]|uniref:Uncharacterized protein n=1 Tax=Linum trigynum TaxID=586398 RepID=A0AAV2E7I1_9ROSI